MDQKKKNPDGEWTEVIEDTKSVATRKKASYVIKRKLIRSQGHIIKEVLTATEKI